MRSTRWMFTLCVSAGLLGWVATAGQRAGSGRYHSNDTQLREFATAAPPPVYPPASRRNKRAGVAVAEILINARGTPESVAIIQSPDADTGRAVHDALMRWTFRPLGLDGQGRIIFYFHMKGARGLVLSPAEMRAILNPAAATVKREDEKAAKPITEAELRAISGRPGPVLLDIRDRQTFGEGHAKGALNIPLKELLARGPAELSMSRHVVIDCRDPPDLCAVAAHQLVSSGFGRVSILQR